MLIGGEKKKLTSHDTVNKFAFPKVCTDGCCVYAEAVLHLRDTSAWNRSFIKFEWALWISFCAARHNRLSPSLAVGSLGVPTPPTELSAPKSKSSASLQRQLLATLVLCSEIANGKRKEKKWGARAALLGAEAYFLMGKVTDVILAEGQRGTNGKCLTSWNVLQPDSGLPLSPFDGRLLISRLWTKKKTFTKAFFICRR